MHAAAAGSLANCRSLLDAGAAPNLMDDAARTALDKALQGKHADCAAFLQSVGAVTGADILKLNSPEERGSPRPNFSPLAGDAAAAAPGPAPALPQGVPELLKRASRRGSAPAMLVHRNSSSRRGSAKFTPSSSRRGSARLMPQALPSQNRLPSIRDPNGNAVPRSSS